jgi:alpha-glucoside transport system substrate-binding protein
MTLLLTVLLVLSACISPAGQSSGGQTPAGSVQRIGGTVSVLATWSGDERANFLAMVEPFEQRYGVRVLYEDTRRDLNAAITQRIQGGDPPDVAALPGPGQSAQLARAGYLTDLSDVLDLTRMREQYAEDWMRLSQVDGKQIGIFIRVALKGSIWYSPKQFRKQGYSPPRSWDDLRVLSRRIADSGTPPWCIGLEAGNGSGWPGTDWLENIVLRQSGPEVYDRWYQGTTKWSSPEIHQAWQSWGEIVADPRMVAGGRNTMLNTYFGEAGNPLFTDPPGCYLHHQASFITSFFQRANPSLRPVEDFNFFGFPDVDPRYASSIEVSGDLFSMFRDTPQARALMNYLTTPEAQAIWVKRGGALSPNRQVALKDYPDPLARQSAEIVLGARNVRFDASDLMPEAMNTAFWRAILDYVNAPDTLDRILANLDRVQIEAYRTP